MGGYDGFHAIRSKLGENGIEGVENGVVKSADRGLERWDGGYERALDTLGGETGDCEYFTKGIEMLSCCASWML